MGFNEESKLNDDQINEVAGGYHVKPEKVTNVVHVYLSDDDVEGVGKYKLVELLDEIEKEIKKFPGGYQLTDNDRAVITDAYNKYYNTIVKEGRRSFRIILTGNPAGVGDCVKSIMIG